MRGVRRLAALFVAVLHAAVVLSTVATPKLLKAIAATATTLKFDWRSVSKAPQYRVQYSISPKLSSPTSVRFTKSAGTMKGLKPDTIYWFRVRVISKSGSKNLSRYTKAPYSSAKTLAGTTPTGLAVTSWVPTAIGLAWSKSEGAAKYELQRSTTADMATPMSTSTKPGEAPTNDLTVNPLIAQTDYWSRVRVVIVSPRAEKSVNGWSNSRNGWSKDLKSNTDEGSSWTFHDDRNRTQANQQTGNNVDWIFATNTVRVKE